MARRRLNIDPTADLFGPSANALASHHGCSKRTIQRRRETARAQSDSVVAERIAHRAAVNTAVRSHKKRQRATTIATTIATALTPATDNVEPLHPTTPAPPALLPAQSSTAGTHHFDHLALLTALPQCVCYFLDGGSASYLFDDNDDSPLVDELIEGDLQTWLIKLPYTTTNEMVRTTFDALSTHPSTVAYALHPPDGVHSGTHLHVISTTSASVGLSVLQRNVNGHPVTQVVRDLNDLTDYLDISYKSKNYCIRYALGGVHFGKAAPAEFRIIAGARLLHRRVTQRNRNLLHVAALAKFLCDRSRTIAGVPTAWHQQVNALFAECALVKPYVGEAHEPDLFANVFIEAQIAWRVTQALVAKTTPPPPPYLAHKRYYAALQSFFDRHNSYGFETRGERATRRARTIDIIRRQNAAQHVDSLETITGYITHPDYFAYLRSERFAGQLLTKKLLFYGLPHLRAPMIDTVPLVPNPYAASNAALLACAPMPTMDELRQRMAAAVSRI